MVWTKVVGLTTLAFVATSVLTSHAASAAPLVDYRAPDDCPSSGDFLDRLRKRSAIDSGDGLSSLRVELSRQERGFTGTATLVSRNGEVTTRHLEAETCSDLVDALAFTVAVALEAHAQRERENLRPAPPAASPPSESATPSARRPPAASGSALSAGLDVGVASGFAPTLAVSARLFGELAAARSGPFTPSLRVSAAGFVAPSTSVQGGTIRVRALEGAVDGCPVRMGDALSLAPCVRAELGGIEATGIDVVAPRTETRLWLAAAALARGQFRWGRALAVEAELGAVFPLVRERYTFLPSTTVHEVPNLAVTASVGVAVTIW